MMSLDRKSNGEINKDQDFDILNKRPSVDKESIKKNKKKEEKTSGGSPYLCICVKQPKPKAD